MCDFFRLHFGVDEAPKARESSCKPHTYRRNPIVFLQKLKILTKGYARGGSLPCLQWLGVTRILGAHPCSGLGVTRILGARPCSGSGSLAFLGPVFAVARGHSHSWGPCLQWLGVTRAGDPPVPLRSDMGTKLLGVRLGLRTDSRLCNWKPFFFTHFFSFFLFFHPPADGEK